MRTRRTGMTLLETMIALFLAVFLIAAILTSVIAASRMFTEAKAMTNATNIANQEIEKLRSLTFPELKTELNVPADGTSALSPTPAISLKVGTQPFRIARSSRLVVNKIPASGGAPTVNEHLIETTVTVTWRVMGRAHQSLTTTSFSEYGYAAKS